MLVQTPEGQTPGKAHSSRSGADSSRHLGALSAGTSQAALSERVGLSPGPWGRAALAVDL